MNKLFLVGFLVLAVAALNVHAECVDGELKQSTDSEGKNKDSEFSVFFKKARCTLKKKAKKVHEEFKILGVEIKEGSKKFIECAKKFGLNIKAKFVEFKDKLTDLSEETEAAKEHTLFAKNVELINPDILEAERICGHGYILDFLGRCKKL